MKAFEIFNFAGFFGLVFKLFKSLNDYTVKSDDENLEILLSNDEDKVKFQKTVDDLIRKNDSTPRVINIKNKNVTISI